MALNNIIRTASRVVPSAIWASAGTRRCFHRQAFYSIASRGLLQTSFTSFLHHYSTNSSSADSLLHDLKTEIECAVTSQVGDQVEEVPEGFPFKIRDNPGTEIVTLTREYQGETISVEVHMPDLVTGYEEGDASGGQSSIPLVVKTSKRNGPYLEFGCTAYPDEITINSLSVKDPEKSEEQIAYEGPDFGDLDENLQKGLHRYLEIRGIKASTTNYLHEYMINKDTREYLEWLKKVHKFLLQA